MELNKRHVYREQRNAQCNARVSKCTGVQQYEIDFVLRCFLHAIDELMLGITLVAIERVSELLGQLDAIRLDVVQARCPIDLGLTRTEQVQIGPVE